MPSGQPEALEMNFFPYEPVEIPRNSNRLIAADAASMKDFWAEAERHLEEGVSAAVGCYIFSIRAGKGSLPWYVGCAEKQSFRKECFTSHKLNHFNNAVASRQGRPMLTLVAKLTPRERFAKPSGNGHRDIQLLENMLIATCVQRNSELFNVRDTKLLREMSVPGLINNSLGKDPERVRQFRKLLGTSKA